jgi:predicted enzyme related to lactoylglutathione lyase
MSEPDWARPVVHWHIAARNPDVLKSFYSEMFNWDISDGPIMNIPAGIGGPEPGPAGHLQPSDRGGVALYIQVRDLKSSVDKASQLGGKVALQPFDVPDGPTMAGITDPEGNFVMLVQQ